MLIIVFAFGSVNEESQPLIAAGFLHSEPMSGIEPETSSLPWTRSTD